MQASLQETCGHHRTRVVLYHVRRADQVHDSCGRVAPLMASKVRRGAAAACMKTTLSWSPAATINPKFIGDFNFSSLRTSLEC